MKKQIIFLLVLLSAMVFFTAAHAAIIVGRIAHVEGEIYRYMDVDDSWVETFRQSPAGTEDLLATGDNSKAEIAFPNDRMVRLGENAEIEILNLDDESGEFALHSGLARFYNRDSAGQLFIETSRGTARVKPGSAVDILVGKESITVSAVHGDTVFHTYENGAEKIEVISGSTSLEFREKTVLADVGPIDRNWDRWCADREGVWSRNRYVRSDYLPESMQEYAYAMEPNGRWQRIYYRGYYYWAWKPHSVAYDWSPYTSGYWYDWHGSPVWIDNNPWGWVTNHHGHWINSHGAWLWTPYVHVTHVPGVTVIGLNITFGKNFRSHWHPGRVRWIAHNNYIGWLPLAPWETYYGYRKWGPRTVVMHGGPTFSININLSRHKYVKHAVVIPKRHLYHRKRGGINNYDTVKIKNINKRVIINNYRSLPVAERVRHDRYATKVARAKNSARRIESRVERKTIKARKAVRAENLKNKRERTVLAHNKETNERTVVNRFEKRSRKNLNRKKTSEIDNRRAEVRNKAARNRVSISERKSERKTEKRTKESPERFTAATAKPRRNRVVKETRNQSRKKELLQTERKQSSRQKVAKLRKAEPRKRSAERQEIRRGKQKPQERIARKAERTERKVQRSREKRPDEARTTEKRENRAGNGQWFNRERKGSAKNREYKAGTPRGWYSSWRERSRIR